MGKFMSVVRQMGTIPLATPEFTGERIYMVPFMQKEGLPREISRWQHTVDAMLDGIQTEQPIYLMVDQGIVAAGEPHRRPGVHIDGYWCPEIRAHGGGGHAPRRAPGHGPGRGGHRPLPRHHAGGIISAPGRWDAPPTWQTSTFSEDEAIILASTVSAARAYRGEFEGAIGEGGDCREISLDNLELIDMQAFNVYAGNVTMLHESLPVSVTTPRTLVRLNLPGVVI